MKIGINATFLNEKPTGIGVFTRQVSSSIFRLHKELIIFSTILNDEIPSGLIHKVPEKMKGSSSVSNNLYRILYINTTLPLLCMRKFVDVLYCPITEFPFIPLVPQVVHIHDLHPVLFPSQFGMATARFRFSLKIMNRIVRRITVSSDFIKAELLQLSNIREEKIDVIPLAYDKNIFKPQEIKSRKEFLDRYAIRGDYILFVGSLFPYKNVKVLIDAFLNIKHLIPHCLVIAGRKEFAAGILPQDERILYMDYVPLKDLPMMYSYAEVFVHPSLREGFGIAPLEAMACGTPVISSNRGSLPEVVGDAGILFDAGDSNSLSQLILSVINNKRLHNELMDKGFRHVKRFSWDRTAEGILQACEKALKEKR
ncbi:MAG: hypothetical protein A2Y66_02700 [Nitrospirae bacterium RBG_13_41_22]|nr:MAG: hypothetical protein A2Y66_02700 [Nitrospirae bacterium RBG_13_41_22]